MQEKKLIFWNDGKIYLISLENNKCITIADANLPVFYHPESKSLTYFQKNEIITLNLNSSKRTKLKLPSIFSTNQINNLTYNDRLGIYLFDYTEKYDILKNKKYFHTVEISGIYGVSRNNSSLVRTFISPFSGTKELGLINVSCPVWSPDRNKVAFSYGGALSVFSLLDPPLSLKQIPLDMWSLHQEIFGNLSVKSPDDNRIEYLRRIQWETKDTIICELSTKTHSSEPSIVIKYEISKNTISNNINTILEFRKNFVPIDSLRCAFNDENNNIFLKTKTKLIKLCKGVLISKV